MKLTLTFGVSSIPTPAPTLQRFFRTPASGSFIRLKHDFELASMGYKYRKSAGQTEVPQTVSMGKGNVTVAGEPVQWFILQTLAIAFPGITADDLKARWRELTRTSVCFTDNGNSWDKGRADYINRTNLDAKPMGWKQLSFGGNVHHRLSGNTIEAIDPASIRVIGKMENGFPKLHPDPADLYRDKPWLFAWATQIYHDQVIVGGKPVRWRIDGKARPIYKVARFPHFAPVGTLAPVFAEYGQSTITVPRERVADIGNGVQWTPYVP